LGLTTTAHPIGNQRPLLLGDGSADLQQQMIVRSITHRTFQKLDLAPVRRQFFEEEPLVHIVTGSAVWGRHQPPCKGADRGAIAQPI
jgi:hypothetical protein